MKLYFVRHGDTQREGNGTYGYKASLSDLGHTQAELACNALASRGVTHIVTSNATRAIQTAAPLVTNLGLVPMVVPELIEIDIGKSADGVTPLARKWTPEGHSILDFSHLGGESWNIFRDRVMTGLTLLADNFDEDATVAVFTHGGVKSVALDHYSGREVSQAMSILYGNGSISTIESNGSGHAVHIANDISHLPG